VQFHGFDAHHHPTIDSHRDRYRQLFDRAAAVIAVSRTMAEQLVTLGATRQRVHCIPGGVDGSRFNGGDPLSAAAQFVCVGRFVNKKAPHLTLQAFQRVRAACPDATLVMIGDGELLDGSRELARSLGIAAAVDFRGAARHGEVRAALRSARAFVMHSLQHSDGDSEGTPIALLEAAAAGLPVIATRHAGIGEVVLNGEMGFLVEERDVEGMAARMIDIAKDPELAARMGARGRAHVLANYSIERNVAAISAVLAAAVQPSPALEDLDRAVRRAVDSGQRANGIDRHAAGERIGARQPAGERRGGNEGGRLLR
jgi:glycosyltransferase involved in cell wall biosynthesis